MCNWVWGEAITGSSGCTNHITLHKQSNGGHHQGDTEKQLHTHSRIIIRYWSLIWGKKVTQIWLFFYACPMSRYIYTSYIYSPNSRSLAHLDPAQLQKFETKLPACRWHDYASVAHAQWGIWSCWVGGKAALEWVTWDRNLVHDSFEGGFYPTQQDSLVVPLFKVWLRPC